MNDYSKKQHAKLTQVIQNFFIKAVQIVHQARASKNLNTNPDSVYLNELIDSKINKWFNTYISTEIEGFPKDDLRLWKTSSPSDLPPLIIETFLDLSNLSPNQTLVLFDESKNPWTVAKGGSKKQEVVLERWLIEFDPEESFNLSIDEVPQVYKKAIILFRSIYTYVRLMPAYKLARNLNGNSSLKLNIKVLDGKQPISSKGRVGLSKPIIPAYLLSDDSHMIDKNFNPIETSLGVLKITTAYRKHYKFEIFDSEEILSSQFISLDKSTPENHKSTKKPLNDDTITDRQGLEVQTVSNHTSRLSTASKRVSNVSTSISPCSSLKASKELPSSQNQSHLNNSQDPAVSSPQPVTNSRPSIQPFRVGSISNSPPTNASLERRFSITSNKSTSNASLVAMLRNQRNSASSSNTSNIPIVATTPTANSVFPKSVSSSHADDTMSPMSRDSEGPRFSSSFGSRASRRFSATSMNRPSDLIPHDSVNSSGSASSVAPLSGIYIDDDISDFVKMIDNKNCLKLSYSSNQEDSQGRAQSSQIDSLSRFQQLRSQHLQLSESVSASLLLQQSASNIAHRRSNSGSQGDHVSQQQYSSPSKQVLQQQHQLQNQLQHQLQHQQHHYHYHQQYVPRLRSRSRDSSCSRMSHSPSVGSASYENTPMPQIHSRLKDEISIKGLRGGDLSRDASGEREKIPISSYGDNITNVESHPAATPSSIAATVQSGSRKSSFTYSNRNSILPSVSPSSRAALIKHEDNVVNSQNYKKEITYENVFEDDDDDLLFTMSDMNLNK